MDKEKQSAMAVLATAKEGTDKVPDMITKKGVKIRIESVPPSLLDDVTSKITDPLPPMIMIESKGREEPNPSDPKYLQELAEAEDARNRAIMDALVLFGVELVDGMPEDDGWLKKVKYLERRGSLDLSEFDLKDELDKEFLFKRYMLVDAEVMQMITTKSGINPEEVAKIEDSFQGDEAR